MDSQISSYQIVLRTRRNVKRVAASTLRGFSPRSIRITLNSMVRAIMVRKIMVRKILLGVGLLFYSSFTSAATKPNLILITVDSTRADRMGFLGAKGGITPNLDRLAGE